MSVARPNLRATWLAVRRAMPDPGLLGIVVTAIAVVELGARTIQFLAGSAQPGLIQSARGIQTFAVVVATFVYGWRRAARTHPATRVGYAGWLWLTPWSPDRPLPLGPVHPALGDVLTLAVAYAFCAVAAWPGPWIIAIAYFAGQVLAALRITAFTGAGWFAYGLLFALPIAIYAYGFVSPAAACIALAIAWVWSHVGLHVSLTRFPWDDADRALSPAQRFARVATAAGHVGWPLNAIGPDALLVDRPRYPLDSYFAWFTAGLLRAFVVTAPLAAWLYVGLRFVDPKSWASDDAHVFTWWGMLGVMFVVAAVIARPAGGTHHPPISLLGRVFTGRLIFPRHDAVYLAPLCMLAATGLTPLLLGHYLPSIDPPALYALTLLEVGVAWALFRVDGEHWKFTAPAHIFREKPKKKKEPTSGDIDVKDAIAALISSKPGTRPRSTRGAAE